MKLHIPEADGRRPWAIDEDHALRAAYPLGGLPAARNALPHRTASSILQRVRRLGLQGRPHWTPSEDKLLADLWDCGTRIQAIVCEVGRSRNACALRARQLGLKAGCPRGYEYVTAAAKRAGFDNVAMFKKVLRFAGVPMKFALSKPTPGRRLKYRHRIVEPEEVDRAVAKWNATEPVAVAARRVGMKPRTLREWMRGAGFAPPVRRTRWRVTDQQVLVALKFGHRRRAERAAEQSTEFAR